MQDKAAFRKKKRAEIRMLPEEYLRQSDAAILAGLLSLPEYRTAGRLFAYCSVGREVDTQEILRLAAADGKEIFLPVVLGDGLMEYARFDGADSLDAGFKDIPEPGPDALRDTPNAQDLLLVPGVCFDVENYRMGQGGGYYDRYLAHTKAITVGLARERLMPVSVPREAFDRPVDILLTDARVLRRIK